MCLCVFVCARVCVLVSVCLVGQLCPYEWCCLSGCPVCLSVCSTLLYLSVWSFASACCRPGRPIAEPYHAVSQPVKDTSVTTIPHPLPPRVHSTSVCRCLCV